MEAFRELQAEGSVQHIGLTGIGQAASLREVVSSGAFETIQVPYNLLNPSAGNLVPACFAETNYGNIIADCGTQAMGVFAIRVFAGGALLGTPPSAHTLKTHFFPLALYERDRVRAASLTALLPPGQTLHGAALQFAVAHPLLSSAIIGFRTPAEIDSAIAVLGSSQSPGSLVTAALMA